MSPVFPPTLKGDEAVLSTVCKVLQQNRLKELILENQKLKEKILQIQVVCNNKLRQIQLVCDWIMTHSHIKYLNLLKHMDRKQGYEFKFSEIDTAFIQGFNSRYPSACLSLKKCDSHWAGMLNGQYMIMMVIKKILDSVELTDDDLGEEYVLRHDLIRQELSYPELTDQRLNKILNS